MAVVTLHDFRAGLRPDLDPNLLPEGACEACANVLFDRRSIRTRPPRRQHQALPAGWSEGLRALVEYASYTSDPHVRLVGATGSQVMATTGAQSFASPLVLETIVSLQRRPRLVQMLNDLYLADGEGPVRVWAGDTTIRGVYADTEGAPGPSIHEDAKYTGTSSCIVTITVSRTGARNDADPDAPALFEWTQDGGSGGGGSDVEVAEQTALGDGIILEWPRTSFTAGDIFRLRALHATAVEALVEDPAPARPPGLEATTYPEALIPTKLGPIRGEGPSAAWDSAFNAVQRADTTSYFGETVDFSTSAATGGVCLRTFTEAGHYQTGGKAIGLELLYASTIGQVKAWADLHVALDTPLDLSLATAMTLTFRVECGDQIGLTNSRLFVELGASSGTPLTHRVEVALASANPQEWITATILLAGIPAADRRAIDHMALAFFCELGNPAPRLELSEGDGVFDTGTYQREAYPYAVTLLVDTLAVADANLQLIPGAYEVCYTYGIFDGAMVREGRPSPVETIEITGEQAASVQLTLHHDAGVTLTEYDHIRVYARPPVGGAFRRVLDLAATTEGVDPPDEWEATWDGVVPSAAAVLEPYIGAPPEQCRALMPWQGRLLYADHDWLRISNFGSPRQVPSEPLPDLYDDYGGSLRIGEDGSDIEAMAQLGSFALIFKAGATWLLSGYRAQEIAYSLLSDEYGCAVQETVCQIAGGLVTWLDPSGAVCYWDGNGPVRELGGEGDGPCPVAGTLRAMGAARLAKAFAAYDAAHRRYHLFVPALAEVNTGEALIFDFETQGWTAATQQPNSCAAWCGNVAVPAIYAGDIGEKALSCLTDEAGLVGTVAEATIPWSWTSAGILLPSWQYKDVTRVLATVSRETSADITLALVNNNDVDFAAATLTPGEMHKVRWRPAIMPDMNMAQLEVSGTATAEVTGIEVEVLEKGRVL